MQAYWGNNIVDKTKTRALRFQVYSGPAPKGARMDVSIKTFDVDMKIKNNGIELDVSDPDGTHLGDLVVTKTRLIWCKGKKKRKNGKQVDWNDFIAYMDGRE